MSDNPNAEVLDFLRERFGRVDAALAGLREDLRNIQVRMTSMEAEIAYVRLSLAELNGRFDRLEPRIYRIERRLDLVDGPAA